MRRVCTDRASHQPSLSSDRVCDSYGDADCVEGDVCVGGRDWFLAGIRVFGSCEAPQYGQPCSCPDGSDMCAGADAGCGPDLTCVQSVCRRACSHNAHCGEDVCDLALYRGYCVERE
jgi:hypothetical protein